MARVKLVNGDLIDLTAEEEAVRDAEEAAAEQRRQAREADATAYGYRERRAEAYRSRLGKRPGNSQVETIGDVLDAVIKALGGDATELQVIAAEVAKIKSEIPKP